MRTRARPVHRRFQPFVLAVILGMVAAFLAVMPAPFAAASSEPAALEHACPAPLPASGFDDVGRGGTHTRAIDCLLLYGITQGVTSTLYEPGSAVNREQMATFIARLMRLTGAPLATPVDRQFTDVSGTPHVGNIEALAEAGVAQGISATRFAPRDAVTRAQMATFIDRMLRKLGMPGSLVEVGSVIFADVPWGIHAPAIRRLADAGVVQGISADTYDPTGPVTRAQMASFLTRAADLLVAAGLLDAPGDQTGPFVAITPGERHSCGVLDDGTARCWGDNAYGRLGNSTTGDHSNVPVTVAGLTDAVAITAGERHSCALLDDGTARCWGDNTGGQLGNGTTGGHSNVPVTVAGLTDSLEIAPGSLHSCAALDDGTARCWGRNLHGQLGNGTTGGDSNVPVTVAGLTDAVTITAGSFHSCAVLDDGTARCWGNNSYGRLGNGTTGGDSNVPVALLTPQD
jgi:hypothetical protein